MAPMALPRKGRVLGFPRISEDFRGCWISYDFHWISLDFDLILLWFEFDVIFDLILVGFGLIFIRFWLDLA